MEGENRKGCGKWSFLFFFLGDVSGKRNWERLLFEFYSGKMRRFNFDYGGESGREKEGRRLIKINDNMFSRILSMYMVGYEKGMIYIVIIFIF